MCGGAHGVPRFRLPTQGTDGGVDPSAFRPSSEQFGRTTGTVVRCLRCGHGSLAQLPSRDTVAAAYEAAADPVSIREEPGQMETARRALQLVEQALTPGRMVDVGCWTGSFVAAAAERGWSAEGIEPSTWALARGRERGLDVRRGSLAEHGLPARAFRLVVLCDVLEHLEEPAAALDAVGELLEPGGGVFLTVPDAGSVMARLLGRRWWSVLPMHLQYFTRTSVAQLLDAHGFQVRSVRTHAKTFSLRYYLERLEGYSTTAAGAAVRAAERAGWAERLVTPNLRDRLAVFATRGGRLARGGQAV